MQNGNSYSGDIVDQNQESITVATSSKERIVLFKKDIKQITPAVAEKKTGGELSPFTLNLYRNRLEEARVERIRLQKTKGEITLTAGAKFTVTLLDREGDSLRMTGDHGTFKFSRLDFEDLQVKSNGETKKLKYDDLISQSGLIDKSEGNIVLSSGSCFTGKVKEEKNNMKLIESPVGLLSLRSEDFLTQTKTDTPLPSGRELNAGEYGILVLAATDYRLQGKLVSKDKGIYLFEDDRMGRVEISADQVLYTRFIP